MSSRARRTAAIMDAAMTRVEEKRSCIRSSFSRAALRFISPMPDIVGEQKANIAAEIFTTGPPFFPIFTGPLIGVIVPYTREQANRRGLQNPALPLER